MLIKRHHLLGTATVLACALICAHSQGQNGQMPGKILIPTDQPPLPPKKHKPPKKPKPPFSTYLPDKASWQPRFEIRVAPLGFAPPAPSYYLGRHISLVSLDFVDEDRLLFTFHATGLMKRESDDAAASPARQIKAVMLALPDGKVEEQSSWTVPDRSRYLWMLKDGQFLVRTPDGVELGDVDKLELKLLSRPSGAVVSLALDPGKDVMVTTSAVPSSSSQSVSAAGASPVAEARLASDGNVAPGQADIVARAMQIPSGQVLMTQPVRSGSALPINSQGYIETVSPQKFHWVLNLKLFSGDNKELARLDSGCAPKAAFITDQKLFVTTCTPEGGLRMAAISTGGHTDWAIDAPPEAVWPLLVMSPDGSRLARESLVLNNSVNLKKHPKFIKAVKGQVVRVIDAGNGKTVFEAPLKPILDAGGNVALSPSGRRLALLNNGAIQVFDLPAAAPAQNPPAANAAH